MKLIFKFFIIILIGTLILNACKKEKDEKQTSKVETKIIIHTNVAGLGKTEGVQVSLHLSNGPAIEHVSDTEGKAVYEDVQPGYYYGSATYDDNGQQYMIGIPSFRVDEGETVEKDIELQ